MDRQRLGKRDFRRANLERLPCRIQKRPKKKMPEARFELAQGFNSPTDFKSGASADSATRAFFLIAEESAPIPCLSAGRRHLGHFEGNPSSTNGLLGQIILKKNKSRRGAESNRRISVLQTDALPLCYRAMTFRTYRCQRTYNFPVSSDLRFYNLW